VASPKKPPALCRGEQVGKQQRRGVVAPCGIAKPRQRAHVARTSLDGIGDKTYRARPRGSAEHGCGAHIALGEDVDDRIPCPAAEPMRSSAWLASSD
jgi:hypothetical protein